MSSSHERVPAGTPGLSNDSASQTDVLKPTGPVGRKRPARWSLSLELLAMAHLQNLAHRRRVEQQRSDAASAAARLGPEPEITDDEQTIRRETAALYAQLVELEDAGKLRWDAHRHDWVKRPIIVHRTDQNRPPAYTEDELLSRFDKVRRSGKGWTSRCPAHEDKHPSLAITQGDKGWLIKCWVNCDFRDIVDAAALEPQRMFFT